MEYIDIVASGIVTTPQAMQSLHQQIQGTTKDDSLSLVSGSTSPVLWDKTLGELLTEQAFQFENQIAAAFPWQNVQLSYRELYNQSNVVAKAMLACGLQHGDRVGIIAGNCFQYITAFLGAAQIGCTFVVFNNTYSPDELIGALSLSSCKMLFVAQSVGPKSLSKHIDAVVQERSELPALDHVVLLSSGSHPKSTTRKVTIYDNLLSKANAVSTAALSQAKNPVRSSDILNVQFTSGTTGSPKAAMLTHNNLINNGRFVGDSMILTPKDIVACPPPLFHCFGLVMGFLASLSHGSTIVFPSDSFRADLVLDAVYNYKATALLGVPTMFITILEANQIKKYPINTIRTGLAAGSSVPAALMRQLKSELGVEGMLIAYGMTETSPVTFITSLEDTEERKTTSVGRVLPHTGAKVIDRDGNIVPRGTPGELCTSGYALQAGYWQNPAKTAEVMKRDEHGILWMHTGDECVIDRYGYCMVTGRIKDIIIRGKQPFLPSFFHYLYRAF